VTKINFPRRMPESAYTGTYFVTKKSWVLVLIPRVQSSMSDACLHWLLQWLTQSCEEAY